MLSFSYSCRKSKEMCGAYLFLPDGRSRPLNCLKPLVKIIEGKLVSTVIVYCDFVIHAVHVYNTRGIKVFFSMKIFSFKMSLFLQFSYLCRSGRKYNWNTKFGGHKTGK